MPTEPTGPSRARAQRWSLDALAREAVVNALATGGRALAVLAFAVVAGSGAVAFETQRASDLEQSLADLRLAGRNVLTFQAADARDAGFSIDRTSCEALTGLPDVVRSGIALPYTAVDTVQFGPRVPVVATSATLVPALHHNGVVVGSALGSAPGHLWISADQAAAPAVIAEPEPQGLDLNASLAVLAPVTVTDSPRCIVEVQRFHRANDLAPALAAQLQARGGPVGVHEALTVPGDVLADYAKDPAALLPWLLGLFGGALAAIRTWASSSESAAYRLSGTPAGTHALLLTLEQVVMASVFLASAACAAGVLRGDLLAPTEVLLRAAQGGLIWLTTYAVGIAPLLRADPTSLAKDR